jgi:1-deoxy-D-xylulose 5-phosphate reductoisomerase
VTSIRRVAIPGSTGSIGGGTLDIISRHPEHYSAAGLVARSQWQKLFEQCIAFRRRLAVLLDRAATNPRRAASRAGMRRFTDIPRVAKETLARALMVALDRLGAVEGCDHEARAIARECGRAATAGVPTRSFA